MVSFIKTFKYELLWLLLFIVGMLLEGFDWLLYVPALFCVLIILIRIVFGMYKES